MFLRAYILEGEQGGVWRGRSGIGIPEDIIVTGLLVAAIELVLGKRFPQGDLGDQNSIGKDREEELAFRPGACT